MRVEGRTETQQAAGPSSPEATSGRGRSAPTPSSLAPDAPQARSAGALPGHLTPSQADAVASLLSNPLAILMTAQSELRAGQQDVQSGEIADRHSQAEAAQRARQEAIEAAEKAAKKSGIFGGKLGKILKVVSVAASAVALPFTGGASAALLVAGTVLMVAGDKLAQGLHKTGIVNKKGAAILGIAFKVAGAAMTAGAGAASGAASTAQSATTATQGAQGATVAAQGARGASSVAQGASTATQGATTATQGASTVAQTSGTALKTSADVAKTLEKSAEIVSSCADAAKGVTDGVAAGFQYKHDKLQTDADAHGIEREEHLDAMEDATELLNDTLRGFARVAERIRGAVEAQQESRQAAMRLLA